MFTGFASENTPAIQVWDFFKTNASDSANSYVSLSDDCAPIHIFRTGGASGSISIFLPTAPIEGKVINISNQTYGFSSQALLIKSSDVGGNGTASTLATLGQGSLITLVYSKQAISFTDFPGNLRSGWLQLNQMSQSSGNYGSAVLSGDNNRASQSYSVVLGGSSNTASGQSSAIVGGSSNSSSGTNGSAIGGTGNSANGTHSCVAGGNGNFTNAQGSFIGGGNSITITGTLASAVGGYGHTPNARVSGVFAGAYGTSRSIAGNTVFPAHDTIFTSNVGVSQSALLVIGVATTDATATVLRSNTSAATTTNQVILPNNSAYYFRGECIAGKTAAGDAKGWYIEGVIKRGANAASTAIVGAATVTSLYADAGAATWAVTATADTTNGGLAITVTGQAATTIRWVCQIRTTEMTF